MGEIQQNDFALYIVAVYDGAVIGYGGMWLIFNEAHITNVAVRPDLRGKNIGKALMLEIIRQAVLRGADSMTLEVRPSNKIARRLYQGLGFKERGVRKHYYADTNEDAIIMWKENLPAQEFKFFRRQEKCLKLMPRCAGSGPYPASDLSSCLMLYPLPHGSYADINTWAISSSTGYCQIRRPSAVV